jgi:hypothetical protein
LTSQLTISGLMKNEAAEVKEILQDKLGALLIIAFEILLVVAALLVLQGNWDIANRFGVYAFFVLVAGIVVQTARPVWARRKLAKPDR